MTKKIMNSFFRSYFSLSKIFNFWKYLQKLLFLDFTSQIIIDKIWKKSKFLFSKKIKNTIFVDAFQNEP